MYNTLGDIVILERDINVLDVSRLSSGVYTLQITYDNKVITKRVVKE